MVELNRAVAVSMAEGPAAGLRLVDALADEPALQGLSLAAQRPGRPARALWGGSSEGSAEFERAASLTRNAREREMLLARAARGRGRPGRGTTGQAPATPDAPATCPSGADVTPRQWPASVGVPPTTVAVNVPTPLTVTGLPAEAT